MKRSAPPRRARAPETYRGSTVVLEFREKVRIELVCSEPFVEPTIKAILSSARTGEVDNAALTAVNADEVQRRTPGEVAAAD